MMEILLFPFRLIGSILGLVFEFVGSVIGLMFSLVGGLIGFVFSGLMLFVLIVGIVALVRWIARNRAGA